MYKVCKSFKFSAAHRLVKPYKGKCNALHGHTWRVDVTITAKELDECGMVADFSRLSETVGKYIKDRFDHSEVNNTIGQPTAENIARHLYRIACRWWVVDSVRVWESDTAWAEYSNINKGV